jgi:hypothetical protein
MRLRRMTLPALAAVAALLAAAAVSAAPPGPPSDGPTLLASGLDGGSGSTVGPGPGGDLYVAEPKAGRITRIDRDTGAKTTFASGLPAQIPAVGLGGVMDVAFIGHTAYALVTLVSADVGGSAVDGIYRIDGPSSFTVVADIGAFAIANPPATDYFVPSGVQYAMQPYKNGFLVTDGHHNRVYEVGLDGDVSELVAFPDIVPTGLDLRGDTVYLAEAGPVPHLPENGKVVSFHGHHPDPKEIASGGRLLVDVELGKGEKLFALSQGVFTPGHDPGTPANHDTGSLLAAGKHGTFTVVADELDQPTSMEIVKDTAYVVTLDGEVWKIEHISDKDGPDPKH